MKSCTIIISHFESEKFLRTAIRQIRKYKHPLIEQHIIICDQSLISTRLSVYDEYWNDDDITIVYTKSLYSGYGLDYIFRNVEIKSEYIVQLHADAFPIHKNWISLPINIIEDGKLAFVGQLQCINQKDNLASIYPPSPFFAMAQCYNVAPTSIYREMAMIPGFTRYHNRTMAEGMTWVSNDWNLWAESDYNSRGSDDDIVAFSWEDARKEHDKLGLAISGYIEPSWGRIIDELVFHFGSCREAMNNLDAMPKQYLHYLNKINEDYSDELINEMVEKAKANKPPELEILTRNFWNGTIKESYPTNSVMNEKIEMLKNN